MSTLSADAHLLYDALAAPRHRNRALWLGFVISATLHAAVVAVLPGIRVPEPKSEVLTVELLKSAPPAPAAEPRAVQKRPPLKRAKIEKPFERQDLEAT